jgi:hypothetical protein
MYIIRLLSSKAKYFNDYHFILEELYLKNSWDKIADLDIFATKLIAKVLGINVEWVRSSDLNFSGNKDGEKVIEICNHLNCNYFINGPASKDFMNEQIFNDAGVKLNYIEYNYLEYNQLHPPFNHYVSVLDVLFNCGDKAKDYIFIK